MVSPSRSRHSSRTQRHQRRRRRRYNDKRPSARRVAGAGEAPARRAAGSPPAVLMSLLGVLACSCLLAVPAAAMAPNEAHDSNNLGMLAQACAESYCGAGVNALDLWLSLEQRCDAESTPTLASLLATRGSSGFGAASGGGDGGGWSVTSAALVCLCVWSVSVYAGYRSGLKIGTQTKGAYPVA